jgi:hypothetical protein
MEGRRQAPVQRNASTCRAEIHHGFSKVTASPETAVAETLIVKQATTNMIAYFLEAFWAALVTLPLPLSALTTDLMTPTATV